MFKRGFKFYFSHSGVFVRGVFGVWLNLFVVVCGFGSGFGFFFMFMVVRKLLKWLYYINSTFWYFSVQNHCKS